MNLAFYAATYDNVGQQLFKVNGVDDHDLSIIVRVSYTEKQIDVTREYFYTDELVKYSYEHSAVLTVSMTGCEDLQDLVFTIAVVSDTGVEYASGQYTYK